MAEHLPTGPPLDVSPPDVSPPGASPPGASPPGPPRQTPSRPVALAVGAAVLLVAGVVVGLLLTRGDHDSVAPTATTTSVPSTAPSTTVVASTTPTTATTTTTTTTVTTTPLPATVVAVDEQRVLVLDRASGTVVRTLFDLGPSSPDDPAPASVGGVTLSRDGQAVFFDLVGDPVGGALRRVPFAGGPPEDLGPGHSPTPSPDGVLLAAVRPGDDQSNEGRDTVVLRGADGTERTVPLGAASCGSLSWSPDGARLAADVCEGGEPTTTLVIDVATARVTTLTPPLGVVWTAPAYRADGTLTLAEGRSGGTVVVTVADGRVTGDVLRRSSTIVSLDWDAAGDLVFCEADGGLYVAAAGRPPVLVGARYQAAAW